MRAVAAIDGLKSGGKWQFACDGGWLFYYNPSLGDSISSCDLQLVRLKALTGLSKQI